MAKGWQEDEILQLTFMPWRESLRTPHCPAFAARFQNGTTVSNGQRGHNGGRGAVEKATTEIPNGCLAEQLEMGSPFDVTKHVGNLRKKADGGVAKWQQSKVKGKA